MATEIEKQDFLDTLAAPNLGVFLAAVRHREPFIEGYRQIQGEDGFAPEENRGLPPGHTPFPTDDTPITIGGHTVTGAQLHKAFQLEEAIHSLIMQSDIDFIASLVEGS